MRIPRIGGIHPNYTNGPSKMKIPAQFHITAYSHGVLLGTAIAATPRAFISQMLAVHDRALAVDLTVYPYEANHAHMRTDDGRLYPLFVYRSGRESMLSHAQLEELLAAYATGRARCDLAAQRM
jgi:hypothetical protein